MTCQSLHSKSNIATFRGFHDRTPQEKKRGLFDWLMRRLEMSNQRNDLSELSEFQLADIGVTRREAEREAGKWFWE
jgi:uncharacterized protein YjiS (DUF1127 family)